MSRLAAACRLTAFAALTVPLLPVQQFFVWFWPKAARRFPHLYHRIVVRILGVRMNVIGAPVADRPCLIACNHVSWLDIPVLSALTPVSFIAKREVNNWPFFGTLARLQRTVFIDRDRRASTGSSRDSIRARLKNGETLILFAEGTSNDGAHVYPFKSAFFGAAELPDVVVQPVTLAYRGHWGAPMTRRRRPFYAWYGDMDMAPHLWEALKTGPVEVDVICHKPLTIAELGSRKHLAKAAEDTVRRALVQSLAGRVHSLPEMR
ncbi:1-acyl-sn-glycerol-3-phosphate acyltransferase [soil metagenome]